MDVAKIQARIYSSYGKAASHIGTNHSVYRSATAVDPINAGNLQGIILASFNVNWTYNKSNKFGNAVWQAIVNATLLHVGDYLVGEKTFYIAAKDPLLPILAVECNRTITIKRPAQNIGSGRGVVGYGGYEDDTATILYSNCPASILEGSRGQNNPVALPTSVKMPWWKVLLPILGNVQVHTGDIITDENGNQYEISSTELTELGWRLTAGSIGA